MFRADPIVCTILVLWYKDLCKIGLLKDEYFYESQAFVIPANEEK
jgi:hypothetical protein